MPQQPSNNYPQYRYGGKLSDAFKTLYAEGGVRRFYRGVGPALIQGPMSRCGKCLLNSPTIMCLSYSFGDTAANAGMLALLDSLESTQQLPVGVKTLAASAAAGGFRILLMPVDACKTVLQVEGKDGLKVLANKIRTGGPTTLFHGALAASAATFVGMECRCQAMM